MEQIIHIWANYNDTFYAEDNKDNVVGDGYETADEAYRDMVKRYPNATVYRYRKPMSYTI